MDGEKWLQEPCRPRTALGGRGGTVWVCRLHSLNSTRGDSPPWDIPARMTRRVDVADLKDVRNVRQAEVDDVVFTG
jgi:hypothetical protein